MKNIKEVKEKVNNKMKSLDKEDLKKKVKCACVGGIIGAAGFVGYKLGAKVAVANVAIGLAKVFNEHPDIKEPFINACEETLDVLKK